MFASKKSVGLIFVSLIFLSVFASLFVGVVSAQDNGPGNRPGPTINLESSGVAKIFDPVKSMFTEWQGGKLTENVAKYLFLFLVVVLIYSIINVIPFLKDRHPSIKILFSIVVGFLSTAYMSASDIHLLLTSYSALGFVLSAAIPFMILVFFSIEVSKDHSAGGKLFSILIWIAFIVFIFYKVISGYLSTPGLVNGGEALAYLIVIFVSVMWLWFGQKAFLKSLYKSEGKAYISETYGNALAGAEGALAVLQKELDAMTGDSVTSKAARASLQAQIVIVEKRIKELSEKKA